MTIENNLAVVGGLSAPDKMPCLSWSTPATKCQLGSLLARIKGSVCFSCYALGGLYNFKCVQDAMERRWNVLQGALDDATAGDRFVEAFAALLNAKAANTRKRLAAGRKVRKDGRVFRWHDSGDVQGDAHLELIFRVAVLTPTVRHWLPTREVGMVQRVLKSGTKVPSNLVVRLSVAGHDDPIPNAFLKLASQHDGVAVSGVHTGHDPSSEFETCIAYTQDGHCLDCRACWLRPDATTADVPVSYPLH